MAAEGACSGRITDVYFDSRSWKITHLLLTAAAQSFPHKPLLVPVDKLASVFIEEGLVHLPLSLAELTELPHPSSVMPVCKQYAALALGSPGARLFADRFVSSNPNLRSAKAVMGYSIDADGVPGGTLEDLILDEETWQVRYLGIGQNIEGKKLRFHKFTWATQRVMLRELRPVCLEGGQSEAVQFAAA
jgi:hypothetical protein